MLRCKVHPPRRAQCGVVGGCWPHPRPWRRGSSPIPMEGEPSYPHQELGVGCAAHPACNSLFSGSTATQHMYQCIYSKKEANSDFRLIQTTSTQDLNTRQSQAAEGGLSWEPRQHGEHGPTQSCSAKSKYTHWPTDTTLT